MKKLLITFGILLSFYNLSFAQDQVISTTENTSGKKYIYVYTFEGASSEESVINAQISISKLIHVSEAKYKLKLDSRKGEFIVTVIENNPSSESEEQFSPKMVKDVFLQNGLKPLDFTVSEEIIK